MHQKAAAMTGEMPTTERQSSPVAVPCPQEAVALNTRDVLVGRQPIHNRQLDVFAYALLFQNATSNQAECMDVDQTGVHMLLSSFSEIGLDALVGPKYACINLPHSLLLLDYAPVFPPDRVVLQLGGDLTVDADVLEAVRGLVAQGYTIALDDVMAYDHLRPLGDIAHIMMIDATALTPTTLEQHVALLRRDDVRLLAKRVGTQDDFQFCKHLGFDYFQGDFLCQPRVIKGQRSPTNRLAILQLLARLQDPRIEFDELEDMISRDVTLSYKLLRLINSAFFGLPRNIDSLRQALLLLGQKTITTWASLHLLTNIDDKPRELITTAMVRAHMCERLAETMGQDRKETFFLAGLFSVLDALMDRPMPEVLQELPLADDIIQALLLHEGVLGTTLRCVMAYERWNWEGITCPDLDRGAIKDAYLEALAWAAEVSHTLEHV